ncbi:hypothetical protein M0804_012942 [Polistes exclamans]|nr:hypothetical protein M0804_012942 [Polistes exclamans]
MSLASHNRVPATCLRVFCMLDNGIPHSLRAMARATQRATFNVETHLNNKVPEANLEIVNLLSTVIFYLSMYSLCVQDIPENVNMTSGRVPDLDIIK